MTNRVPDTSGEVLVAVQQLSESGLEIPTKKTGHLNLKPTGEVTIKTIQL